MVLPILNWQLPTGLGRGAAGELRQRREGGRPAEPVKRDPDRHDEAAGAGAGAQGVAPSLIETGQV